MAYRERQKISQMTPRGANLEATDLLEVSTIESGSYVTKSITGEEIINAASGGALDLQAVTDNGNTTTNDLIVSVDSPIDNTTISDHFVKTQSGSLGTYTTIDATNGLKLKLGDDESLLKNTNVTNPNVILEFPNKPTGSYTIATTSDIPSTLNYGVFSQTANSTTITATTSELTLIDGGVGSLTVPANGFSVGDSFRLDMGGVMSAQNGNTITIRLKSGAVSLGSSGALTMPSITNQVWYLTTTFTVRAIGAAGTASIVALSQFHVLKAASGTQEGFAWNTVNSTTFNTTISNTLNITAQFSSNNANNSIYSDIFTLSKTF
jgi:hypothetical protein